MPRNGSGVAQPVPGTDDAVPLTAIESGKYDALVADIYAIFNTAQPISLGGTGGTNVLSSWDALAAQGADIASAASVNFDTATGPVLNLTGTATVNTVTLAVGHTRFVRAVGASTLTASANLIVNGSTSVSRVNSAGDLLIFIGGAASVVRVWAIGAGTSMASTTEVLTGTDAAKIVTPDALAALWEKGADIASAGTISIGEGGLFHITGNTTITDIDFATAKDGRSVILIFDGALTLTHNATTLKIPGGASIPTAAGDRCQVSQDSGDNVIVDWYTKADGTPVVAPASGGITLFGTLATTSGSTVSLTNIPSGYLQLYVEFDAVSHTGSSASLTVALSSTNGAAYGTAAAISTIAAADANYGYLLIGNISALPAAAKTALSAFNKAGVAVTPATLVVPTNTAARADAIQFATTVGTFDAGAIRVYGVK